MGLGGAAVFMFGLGLLVGAVQRGGTLPVFVLGAWLMLSGALMVVGAGG